MCGILAVPVHWTAFRAASDPNTRPTRAPNLTTIATKKLFLWITRKSTPFVSGATHPGSRAESHRIRHTPNSETEGEGSKMYATQHRPSGLYAHQPYTTPATPEHPQDIRPLITRHRLRRQRRRKAATLLTGASIALGVAALRTPSASAHTEKALASMTHIHPQPVHEPGVTPHAAPG